MMCVHLHAFVNNFKYCIVCHLTCVKFVMNKCKLIATKSIAHLTECFIGNFM